MLLLPTARRHEPCVLYWSAANFSVVSGGLLIALRGQLPAFASIVIANVFIVLGLAAIHAGILAFDSRSKPWFGAGTTLTIAAFGFVAFTYLRESLQARIVLISVLCVGYGVAWIRALLANADRSRARLVLVVLFAGHTVFSIARAILTLWHDPGDAFLSAGNLQALVGLETVIFVAVFNVLTHAMLQERRFVVLDRLASIDPLTGVSNRRAFVDAAEQLLACAREEGSPIAVFLLDLDFFKSINDRAGHQAGDVVLQEIAAVVRRCLRPRDLLGRLGGEEFAIVTAGMPAEAAPALAERIREQIASARVTYKGRDLEATASIGVACYPRDADSLEALIEAADRALYRAKTHGRNRVVLAHSA